ncbi:hypothetical protein BDN72DRAFT_844802 [Pluteus cervinus]|uniref:Uncharacterized protein n=1 Tax=Pluteus cervinus TaxID=181527 RepID=A0ACD3AKH7_9AGAR|nr:hypothetical protein BDN72DRAFT_844802 [Pluteus cervinus]
MAMTSKSLDTLDDSIFHYNLSVSENDSLEVQARLSIASSELTLLDAQISEARAKLASFTRQREQQALRVNRYQGALSISRTLPAEVVRELLIQCIHSSGPMGLFPHPTDTRLVLTQVCSLWRTIICDTPTLWCDYEIRASKGLKQGDDTRSRLKDIMTACFGRAKTLPLNLAIKPFTPPSEFLPVYLVPDVLNPWAGQYGKLDLVYPRKEIWYWANHGSGWITEFPILTDLSIQEAQDTGEKPDEYNDDEEFSLSGWSELPMRCPSLTHFSLSGIGFHLDDLGFSWEQVTTIRLKDSELTSDRCYDLWKRCPSLEEFSAKLISDWRADDQALDLITVPQLLNLSFTTPSVLPCARLLRSLEAPKLRDVSLLITESFDEEDFLNLKNIPGIDEKLRELKVQQGMRLGEPLLNEIGEGLLIYFRASNGSTSTSLNPIWKMMSTVRSQNTLDL